MTPEEIAAASKCYSCMDDTQKQAAVVYLLEQLRQQEASDGTVTSFSFTDANGIAGVVTNPTTTPNLTLSLGAITPISAAFTGVGGAGFISLLTQAANPSAPASGFAVYADSTGRFSWRRQSDGFTRTWDATLTGNRVYTLKDATGTIPLLEVANTWSVNGALSAPAASFTGTPITGGSATTNKPLVLIETSGATSTGWNTSGTMLGVNAPSGFAGRIFDVQLNGVTQFVVSSTGAITAVPTTSSFTIAADTFLSRKAAANWQLGAADAAAPVAQTLSFQSVVAGTADTAGGKTTLALSRSTGTGAGGDLDIKSSLSSAASTTQNSLSTRTYIRAKPTDLTESTPTTIFTVTVGTSTFLTATVSMSVNAADATDFQSVRVLASFAVVNKAGTLTLGAVTQTTTATACSAGTLTPVTVTIVDNTGGVLAVKVDATSSLTQTSLRCRWSVDIESNDVATVTPA